MRQPRPRFDTLQRARRGLFDLRQTLRRGGRRVIRGDGLAHVGLRELDADELATIGADICRHLERLRGIRWAAINGSLGTVTVGLGRLRATANGTVDQRMQALEDRICRALDEAEARHGLSARRFSHRHPEQHPGDSFPLLRTGLELGTDLAGIAISGALRRAGVKATPQETDLVALLELIGNVPWFRKPLERLTTIALTEAGLELGSAALQSLTHGETGAAASAFHRTLRMRELRARRRLWSLRERDCCTDARRAGSDATPLERPAPLNGGPVEHYAELAFTGSLGAVAGMLLAKYQLDDAVGAIFAGVPKAARLGREAFAAHLGWRMAQHGTLILEPQILRRLDRIDRVVLDASLEQLGSDELAAIVGACREAGIRATAPGGFAGTLPSGVDGSAETTTLDTIRRLQRDGHGIALIAIGPTPAYRAADCGIALGAGSGLPPWGAHAWCQNGSAEAIAWIRLLRLARDTSEQSTRVAIGEVLLSIALSVSGLKGRTTRQIMLAANAASMLSMANGIRAAAGADLIAPGSVAAPRPWHTLPAEEVISELNSTREGLSAAEAARRRPPPPRRVSTALHLLQLIGDELSNPMTPLLAAGAGLSVLAGGAVDAALISSVVVSNGAYGALERLRTERLIAKLADHQHSHVRVLRPEGAETVRDDAIASGDVVELVAGDVVPADCRLLETSALEVDESSLTGESLPVRKSAAPSGADAIAERHSMLYQGTSIAAGRATAVAVAVGNDTEARRALATGTVDPVGRGVEARLRTLTDYTAPVAVGSGAALALVGWLRGNRAQEVLSTGVSLAVAAVPEGLPLLAGLAQLNAAGRLSERGALVRNPRAVEALGRMNILCADKTGTLTEGILRLHRVSDGRSDRSVDALDPRHREIVGVALRATPSSHVDGNLPHLTDRALVDGASAVGIGSHDGMSEWSRLSELPFEPSRAYHAGLARHRDGHLISVKGAPDVLLNRCRYWRRSRGTLELKAAHRRDLRKRAEAFADLGYRVLAVAERLAHEDRPVDEERVRDLTFVGFVMFADTVRPSARTSVSDLRRAGVDVVMLTGDHPHTAKAIAHELGLGNNPAMLSGPELETMDDASLQARVESIQVFARVTPMHKVRIVRALQACGRVVGMTGDGANDAAAIHLADVGIALGDRATSAARHAADMIVADGRIETIVGAVLEGRGLWLSVRDAVSLLVGGNLGEILFTVGSGIATRKPPLNARQLLLLNLVTDTAPALAVALRPPTGLRPEELLQAGPDASLDERLQTEILLRAALTAGITGAAWGGARLGGRRGADTVALLTLSGSQLAQTLAASGGSRAVITASLGSLAAMLAIVQTPGASQFFGCRPLGPIGLAQFATATGAAVVAERLLSRWWRRPPGATEPVTSRPGTHTPHDTSMDSDRRPTNNARIKKSENPIERPPTPEGRRRTARRTRATAGRRPRS